MDNVDEEMEEEKKDFMSVDQLVMRMVLQRRGGAAYCAFGDSHHCHHLDMSVGMTSQGVHRLFSSLNDALLMLLRPIPPLGCALSLPFPNDTLLTLSWPHFVPSLCVIS